MLYRTWVAQYAMESTWDGRVMAPKPSGGLLDVLGVSVSARVVRVCVCGGVESAVSDEQPPSCRMNGLHSTGTPYTEQ
jgi:hypothetical protein